MIKIATANEAAAGIAPTTWAFVGAPGEARTASSHIQARAALVVSARVPVPITPGNASDLVGARAVGGGGV